MTLYNLRDSLSNDDTRNLQEDLDAIQMIDDLICDLYQLTISAANEGSDLSKEVIRIKDKYTETEPPF